MAGGGIRTYVRTARSCWRIEKTPDSTAAAIDYHLFQRHFATVQILSVEFIAGAIDNLRRRLTR